MNILMASSECLPFSKTGGLADVAYSLSKEYARKKHNVSVITPFYSSIDISKFPNITKYQELEVKMNWRHIRFTIYHTEIDGISYFLVDNKYYFYRDSLYGFYDDGERFAFFSNAIIEFLKNSSNNFDILHVHDWQVGMLPCLLKVRYFNDEKLNKIKTVLTIHNPLFKGYFSPSSLYDLYELNQNLYNDGSVRLDDQVSTLKAGIKFADKITTVSPTHAYELTTREGSFGLWYDLTLRQNDFVGILNGMDYDEFSPRSDKLIYKTFNLRNYKTGKNENKVEFCKEHNLDPDLPLFAVVSRLTDQKGLDLIFSMSDFITHAGGNFAVLGSGETHAENFFNDLYMKNQNHTFVYIGYNNNLAHKLYAASDFFIMPSKFEPCGLGQMIAHRYGSLPIVRATGGLKDSVIGYYSDDNGDNSDLANGFVFNDYNVCEAIKTVGEALNLYNTRKKLITKLSRNALKTDHTWSASADKYLELYNEIVK